MAFDASRRVQEPRPIREVLDKLPLNDPDQHPRDLDTQTKAIGDEIERNLVQLRSQADIDNKPVKERTPLELIASSFTVLTYGQMMQFARELAVSGLNATTPEEIAATLHKWATTHGTITIPIPEPKKPAATADVLPKPSPIAVGAEGATTMNLLPQNELIPETPSTNPPQ